MKLSTCMVTENRNLIAIDGELILGKASRDFYGVSENRTELLGCMLTGNLTCEELIVP